MSESVAADFAAESRPLAGKTKSADVIIIGAGIQGACTAYALAKRGVKVIVFDSFKPPHSMGSSHGHSRLYRLATAEGDLPSKLTARSALILREMEMRAPDLLRKEGKPRKAVELLRNVGYVVVQHDSRAPKIRGKDFFQDPIDVARRLNLPIQIFDDADQLGRHYPQFRLGPHSRGFYEPTGGAMFAEACVETMLKMAEHYGAEIHSDETVGVLEKDGTVTTGKGRYAADKVILTVGAWIKKIIRNYFDDIEFKIFRQVTHWVEMENPTRYASGFPAFLYLGDQHYYGLPYLEKEGLFRGLKIAQEQYMMDSPSPEAVDMTVKQEEKDKIVDITQSVFHDRVIRHVNALACKYFAVPDYKPGIGPISPKIILGTTDAGGWGFKEAPAYGEILADLAMYGESREFDVDEYSPKRFEDPLREKTYDLPYARGELIRLDTYRAKNQPEP